LSFATAVAIAGGAVYVLVCLLIQRVPIRYAPVEPTDVYEVKCVLSIYPLVAAVVDFELDVWRDPAWLDW
jgi:hypothetical protein